VAKIVTGQATYQCADGHMIQAVFIEQGPVPVGVPGEPPTSNAFVILSFDAAEDITLPQAISASGARYANNDESFVFWIKGQGVTVLENGAENTYKNCVEEADELSQEYWYENDTFMLRYPAGYTVDSSYTYTNLGPDVSITGVKFTIPNTVASGTNLSDNSYISVEQRDGIENCIASDFLSAAPDVQPLVVTQDDIIYSVASLVDAAVGNRYEEHVYAIVGTIPCQAIRYFIHSTAIENYDPGTLTEFDTAALLSQFDDIRNTLTFNGELMSATKLNTNAYPLYESLIWQDEQVAEYADLKGYLVTSEPLTNITDIAAATQPFETYYADLLAKNGWTEDISMAAGGPGAAVIAYKRSDDYIVLQYQSEFGVKNKNEPAQCPCTVTFSVFSGTKE
jgi:membrane-bound inhibitor of C-type lysozyme